MLRVGVANQETWGFFDEIFEDFKKNYDVSVFERRTLKAPLFRERINRRLFRYDLSRFLKVNDVVFFEWSSELLAAATHFPKTCGIVTRLHRYEMYEWVDKINWDGVDKIILVSRAKQNKFNKRFPTHADKTVVVNPSISLEKFSFSQKRFEGNIGILCHLTPRKRVYELILAFYELTQKRNDLYLHIAGGRDATYGDYYEALHHIVEKLGLQKKVIFYSHVVETWNWYRQIDIFVSNSYSEGLQVAPMEAMASGCYCLTHHWDGADELLPSDNTFITNNELNEKILNYCDIYESDRQRIRENMSALAMEKFDANQTKRQILQIVDDLGANFIKNSDK